MIFWTERRAPVALLVLAMAAACALLLVLPGQTVTTKYVNDLLIFLDGAHRVASGQVPNRDFHTALGPLVYYLPAAGYLLSGSLGAAMPIASALFVLLLAPAMAHVLASRLRPAIALPFAAFLILILVVPVNLGEGVTALSFAKLYNRVGWAALASLVLMYLRPTEARRGQLLLDAFSAALLVLVMAYTKISYGVVGLAFLVFMLLDARQRRWAGLALGVVLGAGLLVEAFWRASAVHLADLLLAARVSGGVRSVEDLTYALLRHLPDYVLFGLFAGLALWRTRSLRDVLFYGFCAVSGFLIINQNSQPWGIVTLAAAAAVASEVLARSEKKAEAGRDPHAAASWAPLLLLTLVLPTAVHCAIALGLHAGLACVRAGEAFAMPGFDRVRTVSLWSPDDAFSAQYVSSLEDGARALAGLDPKPSHVLVLDFVSPFSAGLGLEPPRGDSSWLHWGRNVDSANFIPPEQLFGDVRVIMVPKGGINVEPLRQLYGAYIAENFVPIRETKDWNVLLARHRQRGSDLTGHLDRAF